MSELGEKNWIIGITFKVSEGVKEARFLDTFTAEQVEKVKAAFTVGVPTEWFFREVGDGEGQYPLSEARELWIIAGSTGDYSLEPPTTVDFTWCGSMPTATKDAETWAWRGWGTLPPAPATITNRAQAIDAFNRLALRYAGTQIMGRELSDREKADFERFKKDFETAMEVVA